MFSFYFGPAGEAISVVKTTVKLASYILMKGQITCACD